MSSSMSGAAGVAGPGHGRAGSEPCDEGELGQRERTKNEDQRQADDESGDEMAGAVSHDWSLSPRAPRYRSKPRMPEISRARVVMGTRPSKSGTKASRPMVPSSPPVRTSAISVTAGRGMRGPITGGPRCGA